jgi:hypothetical protein
MFILMLGMGLCFRMMRNSAPPSARMRGKKRQYAHDFFNLKAFLVSPVFLFSHQIMCMQTIAKLGPQLLTVRNYFPSFD